MLNTLPAYPGTRRRHLESIPDKLGKEKGFEVKLGPMSIKAILCAKIA